MKNWPRGRGIQAFPGSSCGCTIILFKVGEKPARLGAALSELGSRLHLESAGFSERSQAVPRTKALLVLLAAPRPSPAPRTGSHRGGRAPVSFSHNPGQLRVCVLVAVFLHVEAYVLSTKKAYLQSLRTWP